MNDQPNVELTEDQVRAQKCFEAIQMVLGEFNCAIIPLMTFRGANLTAGYSIQLIPDEVPDQTYVVTKAINDVKADAEALRPGKGPEAELKEAPAPSDPADELPGLKEENHGG